jgi:hypothetical protein
MEPFRAWLLKQGRRSGLIDDLAKGAGEAGQRCSGPRLARSSARQRSVEHLYCPVLYGGDRGAFTPMMKDVS